MRCLVLLNLVLVGAELAGCGGLVDYMEVAGDSSTADVGSDSAEAEPGDTGDDESSGSASEDETSKVDCSGAFGPEELVFEDVGWMPQALSPTRDGLDFFYARLAQDKSLDDSGERQVTLRRRQSVDEPWGEAEPIVELAEQCSRLAPGTELSALDVTADGLRLYLGCNTFSDRTYPNGPLFRASRLDRSSPFTIEEEPVGAMGISVGLSRDELTAYGASLNPAIPQVLMYQRASVLDVFGEAQSVPGDPVLNNPEPAPGGLQLMGVLRASSRARLAWVERSALDQPFGLPQTEGLPEPPESSSDYSPALGADCRSVYFMRSTSSPKRVQVMVARR